MTLDIAMGGSTNTVLHLLAAAHEAEVDFTMRDIDRLSRRVPVLCKVAPSVAEVHLEDVHRAGGVMAILGELDRAELIDTSVATVHSATLRDALDRWDVRRTRSEMVHSFYRAAPGGVPTTTPFSQDKRFGALDLDRETGVIRDVSHAFSKDGGLAVLYGNLAEDGGIVKQPASIQAFSIFPARLAYSRARKMRSRASSGERSSRATWWSFAMKARAAARACRRCSIRPAISSRRSSGRSARSSPMADSPAAPRACRSAMFRRKPRKAGRSRWSKKAIAL